MKIDAIFTALLCTLLLQGCISAVVIGSAAVATKSVTDPRTIGTQVDDGTLEIRIANALSKDQQLKKDARVIATAYQGKILLTGQAPKTSLSDRAKQIAGNIEGANEVYNEIRQGIPVDLATASSDTWITAKIRSQLLTSNLVKSSNVKVTTENGEVFLLGLVTQQEGQSAAKIASKVSGVKHVTTAFTTVK
ncbi:division/outer membrane stress-associated lipid-binding lipoprotein [Candidatus Fukatsuia endosymbiont of Tuberolachnus salignus]|uniref:division/outer membrane stress-associated lipid-binding lipoprotein n=1 Tax=Candidatus Fukatsuia endosymbiont of Tuberolachnus salignus TaxID=3077957 RepID=UPI00313E32BB